MKIIDDGILRTLVPENGCKIYSQQTNEYYDILYLGKNDDCKTYIEVPDPDKPTDEARITTNIVNDPIKYIDVRDSQMTELVNIFNKLINE